MYGSVACSSRMPVVIISSGGEKKEYILKYRVLGAMLRNDQVTTLAGEMINTVGKGNHRGIDNAE